MIHKQRDRFALVWNALMPFLLTFFVQFLVKFNEKKRLVLDVSEQVMFSDEVKDIRSAQP